MVERTEYEIVGTDKASPAFEKVAKSGRKLDDSIKKVSGGSKDLQARMRDLASNAAILEGPLGRVAGRINAIGAAAGRMNPVFLVAGVALSGFAVIMAKAVAAASEFERQNLLIESQLKATGNASGLAAREIDDMALALARNTLASTQGAKEAVIALTSFRNVGRQSFSEVLSLAQDFTAIFKGDLRSNIIKIGRALDSPQEGLQGLSRQITIFTPAYREMITDMVNSGNQVEAQGLILEKLKGILGGAGEKEGQGLAGAVDTLGENWFRLMAVIGKGSGALETASGFFATMAKGAGILADRWSSIDDAPTAELLRRQRELTEEYTKLVVLLNDISVGDKTRTAREINNFNSRKEKLGKEIALIREQIGLREKESEIAIKEGAKTKRQDEINQASLDYNTLIRGNITQQEKYNEKFDKLVAAWVKLKGTSQSITGEKLVADLGGIKAPVDQDAIDAAREQARIDRKIEIISQGALTEHEILLSTYLQKKEFIELNVQDETNRNQILLNLANRYEEDRLRIIERGAKAENRIRSGVVTNAIGLLTALGVRNKGAALLAIALTKQKAIAEVLANSQSAAVLAYSSQLIPGFPPSYGLAAAAYTNTIAMGRISAGLIAAGGIAEAANLGRGGGGGVSAPAPATSDIADLQTPEERRGGITQITVIGRPGIQYSNETMDELIDNMRDAIERGDKILIDKESRNGLELAS